MQWLIDLSAWLIPMAVLLCCSAFFSCSEAALFFLSRRDRRAFERGNSAQQIAAGLLKDPDRLMTAVLFWNLLINVVYFTIASIAALKLDRDGRIYDATWLTIGSLLAIVFFGEMLPKSLAVLQTRLLAALVGIPMAASIRLVDPLFPFVRAVNTICAARFGRSSSPSRILKWPTWNAPWPCRRPTPLCCAKKKPCYKTSCCSQKRASTS